MDNDAKKSQKDFVRLSEGNLIQLKPAEKADASRALHILAYTGAFVSRWFGLLAFELSGIEFKNVTPVLKDHDGQQIVGQSRKVSLTSAGIELDGFVLKSTDAAKQVVALADEDYQWQASAGFEILKLERVFEGETAVVNGKEMTGPFFVARESKLREVSFVPVGADGDTSAEVLSFFEKETRMSEKKPEEKPGVDALAVERKRCADLKAAYPKDTEFALLAIEKGWSLLEAKAEYSDVLQVRLDAAEKAEKDRAEKDQKEGKGRESLGAPPIPHGGAGGQAPATGDFMEQARLSAKAGGISLGKAIEKLAAENPKLHAEYVESQKKK